MTEEVCSGTLSPAERERSTPEEDLIADPLSGGDGYLRYAAGGAC